MTEEINKKTIITSNVQTNEDIIWNHDSKNPIVRSAIVDEVDFENVQFKFLGEYHDVRSPDRKLVKEIRKYHKAIEEGLDIERGMELEELQEQIVKDMVPTIDLETPRITDLQYNELVIAIWEYYGFLTKKLRSQNTDLRFGQKESL